MNRSKFASAKLMYSSKKQEVINLFKMKTLPLLFVFILSFSLHAFSETDPPELGIYENLDEYLPGICRPLLEGVADVITQAKIDLGTEYQVFTISFDPD